MRPCPYCKAQIPDDALKCMYCTSNLLPESPAVGGREDRITYVLDRDLIRFAKFAGAILVLFITIGAFLYGFEIKQAAKEVREAQQDAVRLLQQIHEADQSIAQSRKVAEQLVTNAQGEFQKLVERRERADVLVVSLEKRLNQGEELTLVATKTKQPDKFRDYTNADPNRYGPKLWANGIRLTIRFLDGTANEKDLVKAAADEWTKYANLTFSFVDTGHADIRITFKDPGSWSYLGTDALGIPLTEPTMNLGLVRQLSQNEAQGTVLHEFGHALGLIHENQIPKAEIAWNRKVIEAQVSRETAEQMFFRKETFPTGKEFDPGSIMIVPIPKNYTLDGKQYGQGYELSEGDKRFIARLYPMA